MKKIAFFGGTFDPIHFGHLNLTIEILEKAGLDEVWFSPAFISPLRENTPPIPAFHRVNMVKMGIENFPSFVCYDGEIVLSRPSYTIDTIALLKEKYPFHTFYLLLGEDSLLHFSLWKGAKELVQMIPLLIGCRKNINLLLNLEALGFPEELNRAIQLGLIETKVMEISSTEIRNRIKKRLCCNHLVPTKVLDYIIQNQLYF